MEGKRLKKSNMISIYRSGLSFKGLIEVKSTEFSNRTGIIHNSADRLLILFENSGSYRREKTSKLKHDRFNK